MADFTVDLDALRAAAGALNSRADRVAVSSSRTREASTRAWGLLGEEYGLPELYADTRARADATIRRIHHFFDLTAEHLTAIAEQYEEQDLEVARGFERIAHDPYASRGIGYV